MAGDNKQKRLPTTEEIAGMDPDFTGGISTEQYIANLRGSDDGATTAEHVPVEQPRPAYSSLSPKDKVDRLMGVLIQARQDFEFAEKEGTELTIMFLSAVIANDQIRALELSHFIKDRYPLQLMMEKARMKLTEVWVLEEQAKIGGEAAHPFGPTRINELKGQVRQLVIAYVQEALNLQQASGPSQANLARLANKMEGTLERVWAAHRTDRDRAL